MSLGMMDPTTTKRFEAFCAEISSRGKGITLTQIGDCAALARELGKDEPDEGRVKAFRERLELEEGPGPTAREAYRQQELELR